MQSGGVPEIPLATGLIPSDMPVTGRAPRFANAPALTAANLRNGKTGARQNRQGTAELMLIEFGSTEGLLSVETSVDFSTVSPIRIPDGTLSLEASDTSINNLAEAED